MPCGAQLEVVQTTIQREGDVAISDHADLEVRVLPILPRERLDQLLRDELVKRGWERAEDGTLTKRLGDTLATLAPGASTIRVTIADETSVSAQATLTERIAQGDEEARAAVGRKAEAEADRRLAEAADAARRELVAKAADRLLRAWRELRVEVDEAINATTKQALEQRAAELGSIASIEESRGAGGYEVTITVKT